MKAKDYFFHVHYSSIHDLIPDLTSRCNAHKSTARVFIMYLVMYL